MTRKFLVPALIAAVWFSGGAEAAETVHVFLNSNGEDIKGESSQSAARDDGKTATATAKTVSK